LHFEERRRDPAARDRTVAGTFRQRVVVVVWVDFTTVALSVIGATVVSVVVVVSSVLEPDERW
jgi:hypothetical protein